MEEREQLTDLVREFGISARALYGAVTSVPAEWDEWKSKAHPWRITLKIGNHEDRRKNTYLGVDMWQGILSDEPNSPSAADVLSCMLSDISSEDASFEEWCSDLGYESDSRQALATYEACKLNAKRIRWFLGNSPRTLDRFRNAEH